LDTVTSAEASVAVPVDVLVLVVELVLPAVELVVDDAAQAPATMSASRIQLKMIHRPFMKSPVVSGRMTRQG
jgi:hypothetical protein